MKANEIDLDCTLVVMEFVLKGKAQTVKVHTTAHESNLFVDWLNNNRSNKLTKADKEKFENKFYIFDDYKLKKSVCIHADSVKCFTIPFYLQKNDEIEWNILRVR